MSDSPIIDFHTHIFPDTIAQKAIPQMAAKAHTIPYVNGTVSDLKRSMEKSGITCSIALPVLTSPSQFASIHHFAFEQSANDYSKLNHDIISFGGMHPDSSNYKKELKELKAMGFLGIKIHPDYQGVNFDDIRYMRIMDYASELGFIIVTHSGVDIGLPNPVHCTPDSVLHVLREVHPPKLVLAHMGGWKLWDEVEAKLVGQDVYFDTAFSMRFMPREQFIRIIRSHGVHKILFATDSPWDDQKESFDYFDQFDLSLEERSMILGKNAAQLLNLPIK